jgi:hypothetical protein
MGNRTHLAHLGLHALPGRIQGYRRSHLDEHDNAHPDERHEPEPDVEHGKEHDRSDDQQGHARRIRKR